MNFYAVGTQFLVDLFRQDPLVNTIIFGATDERDLNKTNIFPIVHIMPGPMNIDGNRIEISFDIACVDIRDFRPASSEDKIFGDNLIDSLNQSAAILVKAVNKVRLKHNPHNIIIESLTSAQPIIFEDKNLLDGFEISVVLSIQNTVKVCQ